jgi:hypothetical protein
MQNGTPTTVPSQNEAWGFYGTIRHYAEPNQAWALAMEAGAKTTGCPDEAVRDCRRPEQGRGPKAGARSGTKPQIVVRERKPLSFPGGRLRR